LLKTYILNYIMTNKVKFIIRFSAATFAKSQ